MVKRKIALLGATGSIGSSTLEVAIEQGICISFASAHTDYRKLIAIAHKHNIPKLVLSGIDDPALLSSLRQDNPDLKIYAGEEELLNLVERMLDHAREAFAGHQQAASRDALLAKLTSREAQVLERIVAGRLNKQIADDLGISIKTVEAHRANIMEKLNANTVADLLKIALGQGQTAAAAKAAVAG